MHTNQDIKIRKATIKDTKHIKKIVDKFADEEKMLPLSYNQIYERIRDFWVIESGKQIIGCGSLKPTWKDLAEIRSLAVKENFQKMGYGKLLIENILKEGEQLGFKKIFVLTYKPGYFEKFGFKKISKSKLPHKIWFDCINCPKFPKCDETALIKELIKK
ncbi:MAG TPA: N-acetyltransferase [bacterium]|nr:N-acetyltransferase [bacterium]